MSGGLAFADKANLARMEGDPRLAKVLEHYIAVAASIQSAGLDAEKSLFADTWPTITRELARPGVVRQDLEIGGLYVAGYVFVKDPETKAITIHEGQLGAGPMFTVTPDGRITKHYHHPADVSCDEDPVTLVFGDISKNYTPALVKLALEWEPK